jgi:carboxymethylenebutenolidase
MGSNIKLTAADGSAFGAYVAETSKPPRAAIVVVQEIFGVNRHIRHVADDYAAEGFRAIAPALFDRIAPNLELDYAPADAARGIQLATQIGLEAALKDVDVAVTYAESAWSVRKVGVVGYCFGGTLAWLASTRLSPAAVACYYGGRIAQYAAEEPRCPVMMHFGRRDPHIPSSEIEKIQRYHADLPVFLYDAGHGFNCDQRQDFDPPSASLARQRTIEFFRKHLLEK